MIYIAYVEDHENFRTLITDLLQQKGFMVHSFPNSELLQEYLHNIEFLPDVCIVNVHAPKTGGAELTRYIRKQFPSVKVLAYSMSDSKTDILNMFKAGANGYLLKEGDAEELVKAIQTVYNEQHYFDKNLKGDVLDYLKEYLNNLMSKSIFHSN